MSSMATQGCLRVVQTTILFSCLFLGSCASYQQASGKVQKPIISSQVLEEGKASWYGPGFQGRRTASGVRFNTNAMTCAHRTLPFGTKLKVTNLDNGSEVIVIVNDRGPFIGGRVVDLSREAARHLNFVRSGTAPVRLEVIDL